MPNHSLLPSSADPSRLPGGWFGRVGRQFAGAAVGIVFLAILAACGGGGDGGPATAGPTPDATATGLTQGTITGFGSIFVNGVRFDDSTAQVADDRGGLRNAGALKLGMHVEIEHGRVDASAGSAKAHVIRFGEWLRGPVTGIDLAANSLVALGQKVLIRPTTVFDDSINGGLAGVKIGDVIEVHGLFDAAQNAVLASRIEVSGNTSSYKLRGTVAALDTTAKTFRIGDAPISYAGVPAAQLPVGLANGMVVRVELATQQVDSHWVATEVKSGPVRSSPDWSHAEVRGIVSSVTTPTQFSVNGLPVDASGASFPDGPISLGALVEVEGSIRSGVLVATKVELEDHHMGDDNRRYSLNGDISGLDRPAQTMVVKGTRVSFKGPVSYEGGTEADLADGRRVHVKGVLGADRKTVQALSIRFQK